MPGDEPTVHTVTDDGFEYLCTSNDIVIRGAAAHIKGRNVVVGGLCGSPILVYHLEKSNRVVLSPVPRGEE